MLTTPANVAQFAPVNTIAGEPTMLALYLNAAMLMDDAAQARYAAIYGEPWQPLPLPSCLETRQSCRFEDLAQGSSPNAVTVTR